MKADDKQAVFVREIGTGGRPARVQRSYTDSTGADRIVVEFTDADAIPRDCFATSVFATKAEADEASK